MNVGDCSTALQNLAHTLTHFFKAEISRIAYPGKIVLWDGMPLWAKKEYFKWLNYLWGKEIQALGEEGSKLPKTVNGYYFEEDHMVWIFKREEKREPTGGEEEWMADIRNEIELRYGKREQTVGDLGELQLRPEAVSYGGGRSHLGCAVNNEAHLIRIRPWSTCFLRPRARFVSLIQVGQALDRCSTPQRIKDGIRVR